MRISVVARVHVGHCASVALICRRPQWPAVFRKTRRGSRSAHNTSRQIRACRCLKCRGSPRVGDRTCGERQRDRRAPPSKRGVPRREVLSALHQRARITGVAHRSHRANRTDDAGRRCDGERSPGGRHVHGVLVDGEARDREAVRRVVSQARIVVRQLPPAGSACRGAISNARTATSSQNNPGQRTSVGKASLRISSVLW